MITWFADSARVENGDASGRRVFLTQLGFAFGGAIVVGVGGRFLSGRLFPPNTDGTSLPAVANPLPQIPPTTDFAIDGLAPFRTPNADFYRIDTALSVPRVDPETYSLRVHGMTDRELTLTLEDLSGMPQVEADITLTCVSNEVGGEDREDDAEATADGYIDAVPVSIVLPAP